MASKDPLIIKGVKIQSAYSPQVIHRMFFDDDKMLEFHENYLKATINTGGAAVKPASEHDYLVYNDFKAGMNWKEITEKYNCTKNRIEGAIIRVVRESK